MKTQEEEPDLSPMTAAIMLLAGCLTPEVLQGFSGQVEGCRHEEVQINLRSFSDGSRCARV